MYSTDSHLVAHGGVSDDLPSEQSGRGHFEIDFFPSTLREHPHSLIYDPNDGRDCYTSVPYRRMRSEINDKKVM